MGPWAPGNFGSGTYHHTVYLHEIIDLITTCLPTCVLPLLCTFEQFGFLELQGTNTSFLFVAEVIEGSKTRE